VTLTASNPVAVCISSDPASTAPRWSGTLQSDYAMPLTSTWDGYARGLYTYSLRNDAQQPGFNGFQTPSYGLLNLYFGVRGGDAWDVALFAKNVFDKTATTLWENGLGGSQINSNPTINYYNTVVTANREFGVTARYVFGAR
jgi:outer membrane receptor protein involved in Fe transport